MATRITPTKMMKMALALLDNDDLPNFLPYDDYCVNETIQFPKLTEQGLFKSGGKG